jgi:hypothetical protein
MTLEEALAKIAEVEAALTASNEKVTEVQAEADKWKGHSRDWETKSKTNFEEVKALKAKYETKEEPKDGDKSTVTPELPKDLLDRIAALESRNTTLERSQKVANAVKEAKLPEGAAAFIQGNTDEEIKASIEAFSGIVPQTAPPGPGVPAGYQGPKGGSKPGTLETGAELYKQKHNK